MTITEAISIIDQACGEFRGTRKDHINLQEALNTVRKHVEPKEVPKPPETPKDSKKAK